MSFNPEKIEDPAAMWDKPKKFTKRRRVEPSPNSSFENPNMFGVLNNEMEFTTNDDHDDVNSDAATVKLKVPPIVVHCLVNNHMETLDAIKSELKEDFDVSVRRNRIIIKTKNLEDYNIMIKKVEKSKAEYHTYTLQSEKILKLILKGLAPNIPADVVKKNLEDAGLKVRNVKQFERNADINGQKIVSKLPIFAVDFEPGTKPSDVYKQNRVCYCDVRWEKFQNGNNIVQCYKCQCFGHISKNCHKNVKCVLCAENHVLNDCPFKSKDNQQLKCANCGENHSAGSRECSA